jgi:2-polyprenyl-3-methyl-5-hydroxy-6-metoxy-1,4-benzoquinol methylase
VSWRSRITGAIIMKNIYDDYLEQSTVGTHLSEWKIKELEINYRKFFPEDKSAYVLDIGIGNGEMLSCMRNWGYANYEGIDISQSTINICKKRNLNCQLVNDTNEFLKQNPEKYSVISLIHVIEHVSREDIIELIANCRNALKKDGVLIIETPNMANIDGLLMRYNDFTHVTGYTRQSLLQMLKLCSFENIQTPDVNVLVRKSLKITLLKFLQKIYLFFILFSRRIYGIQLDTTHDIFIAAIAHK